MYIYNISNPNIKAESYTVGTVTDKINTLNDSLGDYNLDNKNTQKLLQGSVNTSTGAIVSTDNTYVTTEKIACTKTVNVETEKDYPYIFCGCYKADNTFISRITLKNNGVVQAYTLPQGTAKVQVTIGYASSSGTQVTPSTVGNVRVYADNAIDQLKADLGGLAFKTETVSGTTTASGNLPVSGEKKCIVLGARKKNASGAYTCFAPYYNDGTLGGFHVTTNGGDIIANTQITVDFIYVEM